MGSGTIAERAVDWDGYTGVIPRTSATLAKVLGDYGYKTAAFGKWHNTPATETTAMGPFTRWPTGEGIGFDYFYGFLAGETSQWEPRLVENFNAVEPPHDPKVPSERGPCRQGPHLDEAAPRICAGQAVPHVLGARRRRTDRTTSSRSGPISTKGDSTTAGTRLRERIFKRQKELGWIPADAKLTPRADTWPHGTAFPKQSGRSSGG